MKNQVIHLISICPFGRHRRGLRPGNRPRGGHPPRRLLGEGGPAARLRRPLARLRGKGIFTRPPPVDGPRPPRGEVLRGQPLRLLQRGSGELRGSVNINEHEPADSCVNRLGDFVFPGQVSIVDHWGRNPRPVLQGNLHWRRMQRHRIDGLRDF